MIFHYAFCATDQPPVCKHTNSISHSSVNKPPSSLCISPDISFPVVTTSPHNSYMDHLVNIRSSMFMQHTCWKLPVWWRLARDFNSLICFRIKKMLHVLSQAWNGSFQWSMRYLTAVFTVLIFTHEISCLLFICWMWLVRENWIYLCVVWIWKF